MRLSPRSLVLAAALAASVPLFSGAVRAQPSAADEERRTRLFKEGKAAADSGQWVEAAEKFRVVVAIRSAPKALIALGVAEEHLNHLVAALAAYKQAREEAADKALADELKTANAALEALRPRVPKLLFTPEEALSNAQVEIDGLAVKLDAAALAVDPGDHAVLVTAPGKGTFRTKAKVKEGEQLEVEITFGASGAPTGSSTAGPGTPSDSSSRPPTGAIVLGVAGVVFAGVGGALYGLGQGQYADADKLCPGAGCTPDILSAGNGARTQMIAGDALLAAGGVALAGATVWWIVSATSKKKDPPTSLFLSPRIGGIGVGGRF